jgi:hypothetical protein
MSLPPAYLSQKLAQPLPLFYDAQLDIGAMD